MIYLHPKDLPDDTYDIAVVGSGAAGTTLAHHLQNSGLRTIILEGGTREFSDTSQEIYKGSVSGVGHADLEVYRIRQLGGSTNCWGGGCVPYDPSDFDLREDNRNLWPISYDDLLPYYKSAGQFYGIGDYFEKNSVPTVFKKPLRKLAEKYWLVNDNGKLFADRWEHLVKYSTQTDLCLAANVVDIVFDDSQRVSGLIVVDFYGFKTSLRAKKVVIAAGGIETTKLLLNWAEKHPQLAGITQCLGKYYSPHINIFMGRLLAFPAVTNDPIYYELGDGVTGRSFFSIDEREFNPELHLNSKWTLHSSRQSLAALRDPDAELAGYVSNGVDKGTFFDLNVAFDQTPTSQSIISLRNDRDKLGLRKVNLNYKIEETDIQKIKNTYKAVAYGIGLSGIGRIKIGDVDRYLAENEIGRSHHTGTTRMSLNVRDGCVDQNLKVHSVDNLWVCSASAFPTPSHANPTFTIMALAIRLSEHLQK